MNLCILTTIICNRAVCYWNNRDFCNENVATRAASGGASTHRWSVDAMMMLALVAVFS